MAKIGIIEYEKLENGESLMKGNDKLVSVKCPFPKLTNGTKMFYGCSNLNTFESPSLENLQDGSQMFSVDNSTKENTFSSFEIDLPQLKNGYYMFRREKSSFMVQESWTYGNNYPGLKTFTGDLSNLVDGWGMFYNSSIENFSPKSLKNLKAGHNMFYCAKLNVKSFENLANALPIITNNNDWTYEVNGETKTIDEKHRGRLGLQCEELKGNDLIEVQEHLDTITGKGWIVDRHHTTEKILIASSGNTTLEIQTTFSIPFYYSKKVRIGIHKKISNGYTELYDEEYTFSGTRKQGQDGYINFSKILNGSGFFANITPTKSGDLDDGTCNTTDITVGFDEGKCEVTFTLSFVKSQLSVNYKNVKISGGTYKVFIGSSQVYPT